MLYSDNGGEYEALKCYLDETGIVGEYTAAYTPEQNGVSERLNRTLMDMTRSMLDQAGLPPSFWAEAITTAVEIRNLIPIAKNEMKSPLEVLHRKVPGVKNIRTFGYEA